MGKFEGLAEKLKSGKEELVKAANTTGSVWQKIKKVTGVIVMCLYRIRAVFLAIPVVYYALRIADYNRTHLPEQVGINLQSSGEFAMMISRDMAVMGPLVLTAACLMLMFTSRKALFPWAVSIFTLALPILILLSNQYPA